MADTFLALVEKSIPDLRRYANALCRDSDMAEDLVQDTMVRSLSARNQFIEGTNFNAWAVTILRHRFYDLRRRSHDAFEPIETAVDRCLATMPLQESAVQFGEFTRAFMLLSPAHREVLGLVGANGVSYEKSAEILGVPVGTVRSRLSRARMELRSALDRGPKVEPARLRARIAKRAPMLEENPNPVPRHRAWLPAVTPRPVAEIRAT